jgi:lipopolysaccharide biosynthesis glycosyltransferase
MAVAVCSLLVNNHTRHFDLTIVLDRPMPEETAKVETMVAAFGNATVCFRVFDTARLRGFPVGRHFSPVIYMRLFAAELFDPGIERVLYLDSDLVVCRDIGRLWDMVLGEYPVAAAADVFHDLHSGHDGEDPTINSGVMILNLAQWRAENATAALLEYVAQHAAALVYPDQEAINAVFAGRICLLPIQWNFQPAMVEIDPALLGLTRDEFISLRNHPGIVHYTTNRKPWKYKKDVHYTHLYYRYLRLTPWRDYKPPDRNWRSRVTKFVKMARLKQFLRWHAILPRRPVYTVRDRP